ncbi:MAG: hypothetical protein HY790_08545 [Deltaproteobacteria bacterium]|nr:hypothetical protein [Deltaproteobacteria bacterium]MBI4795867.1 hypothetical protein [Deltaproteobacteria bacterium]
MSLIHLPQAKWASGTGRQVILKSDFEKIEQAVLEGFQLALAPPLEYVDQASLRVNATGDCKARVLLCGFPSPVHPGQWVSGGLADGRYRENATPLTLNFATSGHIWGTEKANQWYAVYALAGAADTSFTLKAMPVMRVSSQATQIITLRNNGNTGDIGYGLSANELADGKILVLSGASRGLVRLITANNSDNDAAGTITYGGSALTLAQGDWFMVLPNTNFRYLGMVFNGSDSHLAPFYQEGPYFHYATPRQAASGAINGYTLFDLGLIVPPTARRVRGFAAALSGYDLKLAVSYDGSNAALILQAPAPSGDFQGVRGAMPFSCRLLEGSRLYFNNENTANQVVKITGWEE